MNLIIFCALSMDLELILCLLYLLTCNIADMYAMFYYMISTLIILFFVVSRSSAVWHKHLTYVAKSSLCSRSELAMLICSKCSVSYRHIRNRLVKRWSTLSFSDKDF